MTSYLDRWRNAPDTPEGRILRSIAANYLFIRGDGYAAELERVVRREIEALQVRAQANTTVECNLFDANANRLARLEAFVREYLEILDSGGTWVNMTTVARELVDQPAAPAATIEQENAK